MPDQVQTDRQRAETKARDIELAFFKPDFIEHPVKRPSLVELVATALLETEQRARREGYEAGREDAAAECKLVGDDWRDAGVEMKAFAAEYLETRIRALKPEPKWA